LSPELAHAAVVSPLARRNKIPRPWLAPSVVLDLNHTSAGAKPSRLDRVHMKHLLRTLSAYKRLTKLCMTGFAITEAAGHLFEKYMRGYDPANALRELHISITRMWRTPYCSTLFPSGEFLEVPHGQASSVGSSLHVVRFLKVNEDSFHGRCISERMEPSRLRCLRLDGIGDGSPRTMLDSWTRLQNGLERWTLLRELHIEEAEPDTVSSQVLQFLRDHKTIQCISVGKYSSAASFERNGGPLKLAFGMSILQTMLAKPQLDFREQDQAGCGTYIQLYPTLFCVAKQAPVSGTSSVLIGLVALKDAIAGREMRDAKRTGIGKSSAKRRQTK
jgi:hypothetical protein